MSANEGPLSEHTLAHILTELDEWEREDPSIQPLGRANIENQLTDSGYGPACFDQVWDAWNGRRELETTPITIDVSTFGEATFTVKPNEDNGAGALGVGLIMAHQFLPMGMASVFVSADEAGQVAEAIQRGAAQTRGQDPDAEQPDLNHQLQDALIEDDSILFSAVAEACARDAGAVRHTMVRALLALNYEGAQLPIPSMMHALTNDMIMLDEEVNR